MIVTSWVESSIGRCSFSPSKRTWQQLTVVFIASPVEGFSEGLTDLCWWRDNAELLHQAQVAIVVPVLDDLVARDAEDVDSRGYITVGQVQGSALRAVAGLSNSREG
jgi:hypothetical protein